MTGPAEAPCERLEAGARGAELPPPADPAGAVDPVMRGLFGRDAVYFLFWILQILGAAAVTPVVTRVLGAAEFGGVAAANAVMQVFFVVAGCGLAVAVQRWFPGPDGAPAAARLVTLGIVAAAVVTAVAVVTGPLWAPLLGFGAFDGAVRLSVLWAGSSAVTMAALAFLRSQDRLGAFAVVTLLQSVVAEVASLVLVLEVRATAEAFVLGQVAAQVAAGLLALVLVRPRMLRRGDLPLLRAGLAFSLPLVPATLGGLVLAAADRLVVQADLGAVETARYQVAYNIGSLPLLALGALSAVWLPRLFAVEDVTARRAVLRASQQALYRLLTPVLVGMSVGAPLLLRLWAPAEYRPDGLLLVTALIIVAAVPYVAVLTATRELLTRSDSAAVAWATVAAAVANVLLNLVLVPMVGLTGAAGATVAAYVLQYGLLRWRIGRDSAPGPTGGRLRSLGVMAGAAAALLVVLLPTTTEGMVGRGLVTLGCLAWFARRLVGLLAWSATPQDAAPAGRHRG